MKLITFAAIVWLAAACSWLGLREVDTCVRFVGASDAGAE